MKYAFIRRAGALALALVFALTLPLSATVPARAADEDTKTATLTLKAAGGNVSSSRELTVGDTLELKAEWDTQAPTSSIVYEWSITDSNSAIQVAGNEEMSRTVTALKAGTASITLTATWTEASDASPGDASPGQVSGKKTATATLTVTVKADDNTGGEDTPVPVTGVTLNKTSLNLAVGGTETLTATVAPSNATNKAVTWSSSEPTVATVNNSGTVTAVKEGTATVTVTTADGGKTATCTVTVTKARPTLRFANSREEIWGSDNGSSMSFTVITTGIDDLNNIKWTVEHYPGESETIPLPKFSGADGNNVASGGTATLVNVAATPGRFRIKATYTNGNTTVSDTKDITISGLILSVTAREDAKGKYLYLNESATFTVKLYGLADDGNRTQVYWNSSDSSAIYIMNGLITAQGLGSSVITATKGSYTADCTIEVREDESVIAGPYTASVSEPLVLSNVTGGYQVYTDLNNICRAKTKFASTDTGYDLSYITNLKVSPEQGTLYYNYSSEANPGEGVGSDDRYAATASGTIRSLSRLYFVPASGFSGTAEITFNAVATNRQNFSGTIKVNVGVGSGDQEYTYQISYRTRAGEPVWFLTSDFNAFCQSVTGRSFNHITFSLPRPSEGELYYHYVSDSGSPVTTSIQFTQSGQYTIDDVCFVPNPAYEGTVVISFHAEDSAGDTANGTVQVMVLSDNVESDSSSVMLSGERGQPVTLQGERFNDACRATLNDTLNFVIFQLPDPDEGVLYYNYQSDRSYDSRVSATTRYYYSGVPGLNSITFVPASNATGRIAIPYTGYASGGASFSGTLYITMGEVDRSTIYYSVAKGDSVSFSVSDFNNASQFAAGSNMSYVVFRTMSNTTDANLGTLYYNISTRVSLNRTSVSTTYRYYRSPTGTQKGLSKVFFRAGNAAGTVTITYDAYDSSNEKLFTGKVVIRIGSSSPEDIKLSCRNSWYAQMSANSLNGVCGAVMSGTLSYIEITSLPAPEEGRLYLNYGGFGTGTTVKEGDRFYRTGLYYNINQLRFVPHAGFTGETEITYIGHSGDGQEQVSGRIIVSVTASAPEDAHFNDMDKHTWAIDAVDYLYWNGTVKGVSNDYFNPGGIITRADFTLMLVRAYGFTATGSASFRDVPEDSYYADAVRVAALLGIVNGYNGYFSPQDPISRQDAMLIIFKAMKVNGQSTTNGLAADLSVYRDGGEVATYAREAVGSLVQMGIVKGNGNGYLDPRGQLTRAQAAVLLHTIMTL